ncbi:alpha/beta hydrolase [Peribacillus deserti]|uniref:BD-FAE-like domain-containing protein n=1 Tax=Peribacillus deserti TaxID=673318 RepID=A0A2N5M0Q2_9BACI|nr:alpha/beta hydrolase [Peribacillus deserti]PLT27863.1 hypothetical protein CUU66_21725 [Peribacillus deserti]
MDLISLPVYDTKFISDIEFGNGGGVPLLLDLCKPINSEGPFPAIIYIHGGGWKFGDKASSGGKKTLKFAKYGFVTCSINHRSTKNASHPAQIHDVKAAVRWLRAHAEKYQIDPNKIGVWGHSSGGHLAALLGTSEDIPELKGNSGSPGYSSRVQAVCTSAGPTDILKMGGWHDAPNSPEACLIGSTYHKDKPLIAQELNPITHITKDVPPFLIIHGDQDEIVPVGQAEFLFNGLADVSFLRIKNGDHDDYNGGTLQLDDILPLILSFFAKTLKGTKQPAAEIKAKREAMRRAIDHFLK